MNSVVVFSSRKSSSRFLKLYWTSTVFSAAMPSPISSTQLSRFSCESRPSVSVASQDVCFVVTAAGLPTGAQLGAQDHTKSSTWNSTSTVYVAPCMFWAGPNSAPLKECAIMIESRSLSLGSVRVAGGHEQSRMRGGGRQRQRRPPGSLTRASIPPRAAAAGLGFPATGSTR